MASTQRALPQSITTEEKVLLALRMREGGAKYREIAEQLDCSVPYAHELVMRGLSELHETVMETADRVRQIELNRIDSMWMDLSLKGVIQTPRVIDTKIRLIERRAKLLGLDAPTEFSGPGGGPIPLAAMDARESLKAKMAQLAERMQAGDTPEQAVAVVIATTSQAVEHGTDSPLPIDLPAGLPQQE